MEKLKRQTDYLDGIKTFFRTNYGILIGLVAISLFVAFNSDVFLTQKNMLNVLRQVSTNLFLAAAMTMILIAGGIDLSVGSVMGFVGVVTASLIAWFRFPIALSIAVGLAIGIGIGAINGFIISRTTLPPFIVTYSIASIFRGLAYVYTGAQPIRVTDTDYVNFGAGYLGPIPLPVVYLIIVVTVVYIILSKTKLGRHIYAIGGNVKAAQYSGVNIKRVNMFIYMFAGLMAALAGIALSARMYSGQPKAGDGAEMDAIAAVVLGGSSMAGGAGKIGGTMIGVLIIGILGNGLNLMGIDSFWQMVLKGIVILVAVYVDYVKGLKRNKV
jgi:ribose transport system permease protein